MRKNLILKAQPLNAGLLGGVARRMFLLEVDKAGAPAAL